MNNQSSRLYNNSNLKVNSLQLLENASPSHCSGKYGGKLPVEVGSQQNCALPLYPENLAWVFRFKQATTIET